MSAYLTIARFKLLSTIPDEFVDAVEARTPGFTDAQLGITSDWMDSQLRKRYAAPFREPIPGVIELWLARMVTVAVWSKRGIDPEDKQWSTAEKADTDARADIARAADSEAGLFDLPLRANTVDSGIARAFPRGYSEQSPYAWTTAQARRGIQEDDSGHGSST